MANPRICVTFSANKDIFRTNIPKVNDSNIPRRGPTAAPLLLLPIESKKSPVLLIPIGSKRSLIDSPDCVPRLPSEDSTDFDFTESPSLGYESGQGGDEHSSLLVRWADGGVPRVTIHPDTSLDRSPLVRVTESFVQKFNCPITRGCVDQIFIYSQTEVPAEDTDQDSPSIVSY
jgi:hypothetical protein